MVLAMAAFAIADATIKRLATNLTPGQILSLVGFGGAIVFFAWSVIEGEAIEWRLLAHPMSLLRAFAEVIGTIGVISALALAPLAVVTTVMQSNPILVVMGSALFLGEKVGLARWSAIFVGLIGVILVIQPWSSSFVPASLLAIVGAVGLAMRDLSTRAVPKALTTKQLAGIGLLAGVPAGALLMFVPVFPPPSMPSLSEWLMLSIIVVFISTAYYAITAAMRVGEVAVVSPFRYSRILFALAIAVVFFDEAVSPTMILGVLLIVASGLFTLWRERRVARIAAKS